MEMSNEISMKLLARKIDGTTTYSSWGTSSRDHDDDGTQALADEQKGRRGELAESSGRETELKWTNPKKMAAQTERKQIEVNRVK
jgi:hypothetical protein